MTRTSNARLAGFMFLFYIVTGVTSMVVFNRATGGAEGTAATLAALAQHASLVRLDVLLTLLTFFDAVALAVALYALTREVDHDLALLALCCRSAEGVLGAAAAVRELGLLSVATASAGAAGPDLAATQALGGALLQQNGLGVAISATCFAVGSTIFSYLFLRGRTIPVWLAWLGVLGSLLLVVGLPLQILHALRGTMTSLIWIPIAVFEVILGFWLMIRGVRLPTEVASTRAT